MSEDAGDTGAADSGAEGGEATTDANADAGSADEDKSTEDTAGDNGAGDGDKSTEDSTSEFTLPDEHKDKPWASKVKSQEDLYKQIDNLNELVGKKNAVPAKDATTEQLDEFFTALRPESKDAYDFGEDHPNPEFAGQVGDMLFDAGISEHQAKKLIPAYNALEQATMEEETSADGFKEIMTTKFGEKYDGVVTNVSKSLTEHTSKETQDILNAMPNQYLGAMYEAMNSFLKAYGVNEGGSDTHSEKAGATTTTDVNTQRSDLRKQINELDAGTRMYTAQEKQDLVDKLQATYTN